MPSNVDLTEPDVLRLLPRPDTRLSPLERRVRELALHRHELGIALPTRGCWNIQKMFLDPVEMVWWADALDVLGNELHDNGWSTAMHPGHDYVSLRVWHPDHHDSASDSESDSGSESDSSADSEGPNFSEDPATAP